MNLKDLVKDADVLMRKETDKYNKDIEFLYDIALKIGGVLAKKYNANTDIVKIGIALMDVKLLEAQNIGTPKKHTEMAIDFTTELLEKYDIDDSIKENIIHCVEEHHGRENYYSIESEICANADCYKFLTPKGIFAYLSLLGRRYHDLDKELKQLEYKMDEKYNAISLDIVKEELEPYYKQVKELLEDAKK